MNWDQIEGNWKSFKGKLREEWGKLTDDELDKAAGNRDQIEGLIQKRYGEEKSEVRRKLDDWAQRQH